MRKRMMKQNPVVKENLSLLRLPGNMTLKEQDRRGGSVSKEGCHLNEENVKQNMLDYVVNNTEILSAAVTDIVCSHEIGDTTF